MNARKPASTLELSIPADPALALTARMFAGALSRHLGTEVSPDDLKLAFSELLSTAIDAGAPGVVFRVDLETNELSFEAVPAATGGLGSTEEDDLFVRTHRADLLSALFPSIRTDAHTITLNLRTESE